MLGTDCKKSERKKVKLVLRNLIPMHDYFFRERADLSKDITLTTDGASAAQVIDRQTI